MGAGQQMGAHTSPRAQSIVGTLAAGARVVIGVTEGRIGYPVTVTDHDRTGSLRAAISPVVLNRERTRR